MELVFHTTPGALWSGPPSICLNVDTVYTIYCYITYVPYHIHFLGLEYKQQVLEICSIISKGSPVPAPVCASPPRIDRHKLKQCSAGQPCRGYWTLRLGIFPSYVWLVVDLPLCKIWVRQLGWLNSQLNGKINSCSKPPTRYTEPRKHTLKYNKFPCITLSQRATSERPSALSFTWPILDTLQKSEFVSDG